MSLKSRYTFIKKYYPNHLFVFVTNKDYKYYGVDKRIIENFCKSKNVFKWLQKKQVNYLVIDNTKIIDSFESSDLCTKNTIIKVSFMTYSVREFGRIRLPKIFT